MDVKDASLIVLAGGKSSRMGTPKGLLEMHGRSWLEVQLARAHDRGVTDAVVALGYHAEDYLVGVEWLRRAMRSLQTIGGLRVRAVVNARPELGPFSTIQAAAGEVDSGKPAFVLPIDVPAPKNEVWARLAAELKPGIEACVPEWLEKGGHPVLLSSSLLGELLLLDPELPTSRLDFVLRELPRERVARVAVGDPSIRMNLNDLADWERYLESGVA